MITGKIKEIPLGGLTSALSDYDCADGEMQICHNMISDGAGLKPIADVEVKLTLPENVNGVVFTHHTSVGVVYIVYDSSNSYLEYGDADRIVRENASEEPKEDCRFILPTDFTLEEGKYSLSSVGNILVLNVSYGEDGEDDEGNALSANNGLHYFLFHNRKTYGAVYEYLGQRPPDVGLMFEMYYPNESIRTELDNKGDSIEHIKERLGSMPVLNFTSDDYETSAEALGKWATVAEGFSVDLGDDLEEGFDFNGNETVQSSVMGCINEHVKYCKQTSRFLQPFFVRYAYRLYDGSYIMQSSPVLMVPDYGLNPFVYGLYNSVTHNFAGLLLSRPMELRYKATISEEDKEALGKWKDIIQGVAIFVTPQITCYSETGDTLQMQYMGVVPDGQSLYGQYVDNGLTRTMIFQGGTFEAQEYMTMAAYHDIKDETDDIDEGNTGNKSNFRYLGGGYKRAGSWNDWVMDAYTFYELREYQLDDLATSWASVKRTGGMEYLETFTQLPDGYHERTLKNPKFMHSYNGRLSIANVDAMEMATMPMGAVAAYSQRGKYQSSYEGYTDAYIKGTFTVYIESGGTMNKVVIDTGEWGYFSSWPGYFFYPNPDAKYLFFNGTVAYGENDVSETFCWKLKPHPHLHGAYFFRDDFGYYAFTADGMADYTETSTWEEGWIHQTNYLYTSEVDNPFVFPSQGVEAIGSGEITAIKDSTKAVSEGTAFGAMPLYAFCTDGIWALEVGSTGQYTAKQPVSRETLLGGDAGCATQIDNSVLFLSDRGLMELSGGRTRLLSAALQGRGNAVDTALLPKWGTLHDVFGDVEYRDADDFIGFIKQGGARIAFDYERHRAVIYRSGDAVAYVYDIGTGAWATMASRIRSSLEGFPSTLLNLERTDGKTDVGAFTLETDAPIGDGMAFYLTRPLKLGEADTLKTVRTLVERGVRGGDGEKYLALWGSRDMRRWALVAAVKGGRIPRLGGTPFKWFAVGGWTRFTAVGERISRLTLESVDRQADKIR